MKTFGIILMVVGAIWALVAFNMNTAVTSPSQSFGSGAYTIETPSVTVNNLGLMDRRRNNLIFAGFTILVGAVFVGFGSISRKELSEGAGLVSCPYCAELVKPEAVVCKHCGKDIAAAVSARKQQATEHQHVSAQEVDRQELTRLCTRLRESELNYDQYSELAQSIGASLVVLTGAWSAQYVVTSGDAKVTFKRYKELRPWFLENVVPKVEQGA